MSASNRRAKLDRDHPDLSVRQCAMLGVARSEVYRKLRPANDNELEAMRRCRCQRGWRRSASGVKPILFRARNGMAALARTPILPEATSVGALSAEAVRKGDVQGPMRGRPGSAVGLVAV